MDFEWDENVIITYEVEIAQFRFQFMRMVSLEEGGRKDTHHN